MFILACAFMGCANSQIKDEETRVKETKNRTDTS